MYVAAVAYVYKVNNWMDPTTSFLIHKLMERFLRLNHKSDARWPIPINQLGKMCNVLNTTMSSSDETALLKTAFLLTFFKFLWVGEFSVLAKAADC